MLYRCLPRVLTLVSLFLFASAQTTLNSKQQLNGSTTPLLIPDREAYMMLFLDLADGSSARPLKDRLSDLKNECGLSATEAQSVVDAANRYQSVYAAALLKIKEVKKSTRVRPYDASTLARLDLLIAQGWSTLSGIKRSLDISLGAESAGKLQRYVNMSIKPYLVVAPGK
jgi:hypothetical protein